MIHLPFQCCKKPVPPPADIETDDDVEAEKEVALAHGADQQQQDHALVVQNMAKKFGDFEAVRGLSFTVKQGN